MELNALTSYIDATTGHVARDIRRLKSRSLSVSLARKNQHSRRQSLLQRSLDTRSSAFVPLGSVSESRTRPPADHTAAANASLLADLEALRVETERLQKEQAKLDHQLGLGSDTPTHTSDLFPPGHQKYVYLAYRAARRLAKGFMFGYCGKFAFSLLGLLLRYKYHLTKLIPAIVKLALKPELFRYGGFLGAFLMLFEAVVRFLRMKGRLGQSEHARTLRVLLSATVASTAAYPFLPRDVRLSVAMFFLVRALEILLRFAVEEHEHRYVVEHSAEEVAESKRRSIVAASEHHLLQAIQQSQSKEQQPQLVRSRSPLTAMKALVVRASKNPLLQHADVIAMGLASAQIIWAWLHAPKSLAPSYERFLNHQGGRPMVDMRAGAWLHYHDTLPTKLHDALDASRVARGFQPINLSLPKSLLLNEVGHPAYKSILVDAGVFFLAGLRRAAPVYLPVYLLPMLLFKSRQLIRSPLAVLLPTASNLLRSSAFLSGYVTTLHAVIFGLNTIGLSTHHASWDAALGGFLGGCCVSIERKSRRVELALYCMSQALPSLWRTLHARFPRLVPMVPHGECFCFVASMAVLMWAYVTRPHLWRSSYLALFKYFFGSGGRSAGFSTRAVEHSTPKPKTMPMQPKQEQQAVDLSSETVVDSGSNSDADSASAISSGATSDDDQHDASVAPHNAK